VIQELSQEYAVAELCQVLEVGRSGYYRWHRSPVSARQRANVQLARQIQAIYRAKKGAYGSRRLTQELRRAGLPCNHKRVERLMRQQGLRARSGRKRRVQTTHSEHDLPVAPNLLRHRPPPCHCDEVWVADITYVPTAQGWLFLAAVMDLYSRQILGWSLWRNLAAGGPLQALSRALVKRGYPRGVIHHSDRGIQYASRTFRQQLVRCGLLASMSRRGNCYDNAAMEAFWSTLKREALEQSAAWSEDRTRRAIFEYIESIYNRSRLHSSLGYKSPVDFETNNS
jgi:transposase InsO family protein